MKCENCGKNEVNFVYRSSINGHTEEARLCAECAEKLGYTQRVAQQNRAMFQDFFGGSGFFADPFGADPFFAPAGRLLGRMMADPFDSFFSMPALNAAPAGQDTAQGNAQETAPVRQENTVNQTSQADRSHFSKLRERNALRMEMKRAVREENFERAAEIRDRLRQMEQSGEQ